MVVRKLSLADWFIRYQLLKLKENHFYTPIFADVNINSLLKHYGSIEKVPITALVIKAAALLREVRPQSHRAIIPSLFGPRRLEFSEAKVNVPILLKIENKKYLSGLVLEKLEDKDPMDIQMELRGKAQFCKKRFPICNFVSKFRNNFISRALLKTIYFFAYRNPKMFLKKAGGISVSISTSKSLNDHDLVGVPMGPTALSIGVAGTNVKGGDCYLKLGVGYDHAALLAHDALTYLGEFSNILNGKNKKYFKKLVGPTQIKEPRSPWEGELDSSTALARGGAGRSPHKDGLSPSI